MSESLTMVTAVTMVALSFVATAWAALTLTVRAKSTTDRNLYIFFSLLLPTQLGVAFLLRGSFHGSYLTVALFMLSFFISLAGSLLLFVLGIVLTVALRRERPFVVGATTCLSAALFVVLCFTMWR